MRLVAGSDACRGRTMSDGLPLDTESMASGDPSAAGALDLGRETLRPELPKVGSAEDYAALPHGKAYLDPTGKQRFKPIRDKNDYIALEEGAEYADPTGTVRTKPKYEGIDFSPQALYDIAHSDKGRKMALEKYYPGKVKEDPNGGFYIEDEDGKLRKPGRGLSKFTGGVAAEAIPMVLSAGGSLLGGAVGTLAEPGGGTVVGGAAGGYGGGYAGQRINDIFSQLAGVYDPEGAESNARMSGVAGALGDVGGRAVSALAPVVKEGAQAASKGAAKTVNKMFGTDADALNTAVPIAEMGEADTGMGPFGVSKAGTEVSPSAIFKASPHLVNVSETLAQKFDSSHNYIEHAEKFMDKRAKEILAHEDIGAIVEGSVVHPKAAVSTEEAGSLLKQSAQLRAINQSVEAERQLQEALANRRAAVEAKHAPDIEAHRARNDSVVKTAEQAKAAADNLVNEGFQAIEKQANDAVRVAQVGHNAGDLWRSVAESFVKLRRSIAAHATGMYRNAHTVSNGLVPPGAESLAPRAQALLDELPEGFAASHPAIVQRIARMAGQVGENGEVIRPPTAAAWTELHELRTMLRQDIKWNDLTPGVKDGALKHMQNGIDAVLHSVENQPELQEASRLLRLADDFYRENMGPLNDRHIKALVKALDSGLQADPKALLKATIREGKTEVANIIRNTVGPQIWDAMRAADVQDMLSSSRLLDGSIDGVQFAKEVLQRQRAGVLGVLHGESGAARLNQQATYIEQLRGKLTITSRPGDTANDIILRARSAVAEAENLSKTDPLKLMANEMKKVEASVKKEFAATRKPDPLAFLNDATVGANKAVDRILGDPDLIVAASRAFPGGEKSPEFQLMRQVWTQRFLSETLEPGEKLAATSEEIQRLMFPGITLTDMHMLAKEMRLLMSGHTMGGSSSDMGGSMMAQSAVENPWGRIGGIGKLAGPAKIIPGANFAARSALTVYYNMVRGLLTSPSTLRWLQKGLTSHDPAAKEAARTELRAALQRSGARGAGVGQGINQWANGQNSE
jgi:hypothetical protein